MLEINIPEVVKRLLKERGYTVTIDLGKHCFTHCVASTSIRLGSLAIMLLTTIRASKGKTARNRALLPPWRVQKTRGIV